MLFQPTSLILTVGLLASYASAAHSSHERLVRRHISQRDNSDALKGVTPASGNAYVTAHQFEADCHTLLGTPPSKLGLAPASCGIPYEGLLSRGNKLPCSGLAAIDGAPCGSCIKLTYGSQSTTVRVVGNHGGGGATITPLANPASFDISLDNFKDLAPNNYWNLATDPYSGAGTSPLSGVQYVEVNGSECDMHWNGQCWPQIFPGVAFNAGDNGNVPGGYGCS